MKSQASNVRATDHRGDRVNSLLIRLPLRDLCRGCVCLLSLVGFLLVLCSTTARADIFQWDWINPADHGLGKFRSSTVTPGGSGVSAVPNANLTSRDLSQAYLIGTNLTSANLSNSILTNADLSGANLTNAWIFSANLTGTNFT